MGTIGSIGGGGLVSMGTFGWGAVRCCAAGLGVLDSTTGDLGNTRVSRTTGTCQESTAVAGKNPSKPVGDGPATVVTRFHGF